MRYNPEKCQKAGSPLLGVRIIYQTSRSNRAARARFFEFMTTFSRFALSADGTSALPGSTCAASPKPEPQNRPLALVCSGRLYCLSLNGAN
jgi:hypothetical protein